MAYQPAGQSEFFVNVALGLVSGHSVFIMRGHNPSQTAASGFVDMTEFGNITYLAAAETMDITSSSANDAAAGTGMRTMLIVGVDGTGAEASEVVALNGLTIVTTVNSYLRINLMVGQSAGSLGHNDGTINATATTAATTQCEIFTNESISHSALYTVPLGKTALIYRVEFNATKTGGGQQPVVEFRGFGRDGSAANPIWVQLFDKKVDTSVADELDVDIPLPSAIAARSDIRLATDTDQNGTEPRVRMYLLLVDD